MRVWDRSLIPNILIIILSSDCTVKQNTGRLIQSSECGDPFMASDIDLGFGWSSKASQPRLRLFTWIFRWGNAGC